jgi:hypothetical protein
VHLLVGVARIQEALGNLSLSAKYYKARPYSVTLEHGTRTNKERAFLQFIFSTHFSLQR